MNVLEAKALAVRLMGAFGLPEQGWRFAWTRGKRVFGVCRHRSKVIGLSQPLTALNESSQVEDTIRHEIAHALCGTGHGHGARWKEMAIRCGARPERCYSAEDVAQPEATVKYQCPACAHVVRKYRRYRRETACKRCCDQHNDGKFDPRFQFRQVA